MKIELTIALVCLTVMAHGDAAAEDRAYRYELDMSQDERVCSHMLEVYNRHFREPWNPQKRQNVDLKTVFSRLPGVDYDLKFLQRMIYSKFPISAEFEAVQWREGRFLLEGGSPQDITMQSMLVAEFDIDNDGNLDTVIKTSFMDRYTYHAGWDGRDGGTDGFQIFPKGGIDLSRTLNFHELAHGQPGQAKPRNIEDRSLRPFILDGVTYLSQYRQVWPQLLPGEVKGYYPDAYPEKEYMHVLKYRGGGQNLGGGKKYTDVDMESICRFRMIAIQ